MFESGQDFPGGEHAARYDDYARRYLILRGDHASAWTAKRAIKNTHLANMDYGADRRAKEIIDRLDSDLSVVVNLPRVIERKFASLLLRGFRLVVDDEGQQELLDDILKASGGVPMLHRCAFRLCGYGNAVTTVRRDASGVVRVDARAPWTWYPELDPADASRVLRHVFAWRYEQDDHLYLLQEVHEPGRIVRAANVLDGLKGAEKVGAPTSWAALGFDPAVYRPEELTGIDEPLVAVWQNVTDEESVYGASDLEGNEPLANEVTSRVTQISSILDKHADPKMQGPESVVKTDPVTLKVKVDVSGDRFFPRRGADDAPYEYLTWDAHLADAYGALDRSVRLLCLEMGMAPALLGLEEGAGVEATATLRVRAINTVDDVESKRMFARPGIVDTFRLALRLAGVADPQVAVEFGDVLPLSRQELLAAVREERAVGLISKERALRRLNPELSDEEIADELDRLDREEAGVLNPGQA